MTRALYPGTFDPFHRGHLDVVERAAGLFDEVLVGVLQNPDKDPLFDAKDRARLITEATVHLANVRALTFQGLTVECAQRLGARVILRGLRAVLDYDYEAQMALMNRQLAPDVETVFMLTSSQTAYYSSSLIRQLARLDAPLQALVTENVEQALKKRLKED